MPKVTVVKRTKVTQKKRRRRSTEEITDLLIEAACDEFELNGYEGTKTAAIAKKAGVTEALIFSNFGSKAKLFQDSIFKPLNQHFLQFTAAHLVGPDDEEGLKEGTRQYILELQQFIRRHSRMLTSVVAAQMYESENVQGVSQIEGLNDYFSRATARAMKRLSGKPKIDPRLMARVSFATILACILFKDWLFPKGLATQDEISAAISDFVMEGLGANADPQPKAPGAARPRRSPSAAGSAKKR
ncbi:MAG: transcriptional regulator [Hydrocarboniphaga sp.]|uniref:TetR/AcrR family transcriptional regulator n=1 Tax=Hydrocarboniphaga sp. TaxID=2033016 RepID=UPI00260CE51F|nr:TetR/AcrR family transcriptional regulator [Hydrocarboniphaga sp.]MDB5972226.1 transcriptional regulator [Hydrocarboniphaga sp.]